MCHVANDCSLYICSFYRTRGRPGRDCGGRSTAARTNARSQSGRGRLSSIFVLEKVEADRLSSIVVLEKRIENDDRQLQRGTLVQVLARQVMEKSRVVAGQQGGREWSQTRKRNMKSNQPTKTFFKPEVKRGSRNLLPCDFPTPQKTLFWLLIIWSNFHRPSKTELMTILWSNCDTQL